MLILMLILACIMVLTLIALILRKEISLNKRNFLFFLSFILYAIISVLLIKKGIQLENSEKSYNIAVKSYPLQHINKDSYYDIQGNQILIKVKDDLKTLNKESCNIKQSNNSPELIETNYILKNKFYRFLFGEIHKPNYYIQIPKSD